MENNFNHNVDLQEKNSISLGTKHLDCLVISQILLYIIIHYIELEKMKKNWQKIHIIKFRSLCMTSVSLREIFYNKILHE